MMTSGAPLSDGRITDVAAAFLRFGADTLSARMLTDLPREGDWLLALAARVGVPADERRAAVARARRDAADALARAAAAGQRPLVSRDDDYPPLLRQIADPPIVLWTRGDASLLSRPAVAVVGARAATPAGLEAARRLGRDLAAAGLVVVSGLARGVDGAAHQGALDADGLTVAILGSGLDVVYPSEHRALAARIAAGGVLASELPPGAPPLGHHFPLRNRIISGLSKAVVVIEASLKSGSLITARAALEQGRDVLAVPGGIASGRYRGSHGLIKDGARLVESVEDVLEEIGWPLPARPPRQDGKSFGSSKLSVGLTRGEPCSVDELARRTGRPAADLLSELSVLEVEGRVARVAGGGFVRLD